MINQCHVKLIKSITKFLFNQTIKVVPFKTTKKIHLTTNYDKKIVKKQTTKWWFYAKQNYKNVFVQTTKFFQDKLSNIEPPFVAKLQRFLSVQVSNDDSREIDNC